MSKHQHVGHTNVHVPQFMQENAISSQNGASYRSRTVFCLRLSVPTFALSAIVFSALAFNSSIFLTANSSATLLKPAASRKV